MLWIPKKGILRVQHNFGAVGATTIGTSVTTGAASGTKGTPVALFTTSFDAYWIEIFASNYGAAATTSQCCLDILKDTSTPKIIIPDLLAGFCGAGSVGSATETAGPKRWAFPLYIPSGTVLAAQAAGDRTSTSIRVGCIIYGGDGTPPFRVGRKVTTYGITAVPAGTDVAAGYSGAQGSWVQITAGTSEDHFAFMPSFHPTDGDTTLTPHKHVVVGIGIGAATEELMIGGEFWYRYGTNELCEGPYQSMPAFCDIPSGTRLSLRVSMSGVTDTGEPDCALHAVS